MKGIYINKTIIALTTILCICNMRLYAQQFMGTAKVECPSEVVANETFEYSIDIQTDSVIQVVQLLPSFATIEVMGGPKISRSTSIIYKDGKKINEYSLKYTYVLCADVGIHKIPTFQIKDLAGNYYNVPEITIESKEKNIEPAINTTNKVLAKNNNQKEKPNQNDDSKVSVADSTILVLSLDKSTAIVGEPVLVTAKLATREQVVSVENVKYDFDYCYIKQVEDSDTLKWDVEVIDGVRYQTIPLLQYQLYPLQHGEIILHPIEIQITKAIRVPDPTDIIFGMSLQYIKQTIKSDELVLKVIGDISKERGILDIKPYNDNFLVALDISGSMRSYDFDGSRLDVAKKIVSEIKYCYPQTHILPYTSKFGDVIYSIDKINDIDSLNIKEVDGSALYDVGLFFLYNHYRGLSYRDIVIITDGVNNTSHISSKTFADLMAKYGVRIHIVSINSNKEKVEADVYDNLNNRSKVEIDNIIGEKDTLRELTKSTGGEYLEIRHISEIDDTVNSIVNAIGRKVKAKKPSKQYNISDNILKEIAIEYYNNNRLRCE